MNTLDALDAQSQRTDLPDFRPGELGAYRFYRFRPRRLKLFDEQELGPGWFVTARVAAGGRLEWERTEIYRSAA